MLRLLGIIAHLFALENFDPDYAMDYIIRKKHLNLSPVGSEAFTELFDARVCVLFRGRRAQMLAPHRVTPQSYPEAAD